MPTSPISSQFKPVGRERINVGLLAYMRGRNRGNIYNSVIEEFERSGISRAVLASRLGKAPEVISRWLGSPGNWTLDTVSDLFFAISGGEPAYGVQYPLDPPAANGVQSNITTSVAYCGPHDLSYTNGTVSYATPVGVGFQGGGSLSLGTPIGTAYLATATSVGSNASVGQMGSAPPSNSNLTVWCANSSGYGASAAEGPLPGQLFAHSGNEFSLNPLPTPTNGYQGMVAVMTPSYQIEEIAAVMAPDRVSVLR
jgi:hypothetical protein